LSGIQNIISALSSLETMFLFTDHHLLKQIINHKVMLERKKCYISNHDSTAVGLTFVLLGESPEIKTSIG